MKTWRKRTSSYWVCQGRLHEALGRKQLVQLANQTRNKNPERPWEKSSSSKLTTSDKQGFGSKNKETALQRDE